MDKIEIASKQLERVLGFFPRVESKGSFATALTTAMIGAISVDIGRVDAFHLWQIPCALFLACSLMVYWKIYRTQAPKLDGGTASKIYFREIAKARESAYVTAFLGADENELARDLVEQTWRNSKILTEKFNSMESAFHWLGRAVALWVLAIILVHFEKLATYS